MFLWVPAIALGFACWYEVRGRDTLQDFGIFRAAALDLVRGQSPYVAATPEALAHFDKFVYPPVSALLFTPFAAFPPEVGRALVFGGGLVAIVAALRLLHVEDWRCYGVALMSTPAINSLALGALTSFLLLGAAAGWRYRNRAGVVAVVVALTSVLKLFLWPLVIWLLATRRWRSAAGSVAAGVVLLLGSWAVIGFAGMGSYPTLLQVLERIEAPASYSVVALVGAHGSATALSAVLAVALAVAVVLAARTSDGDRRAFAAAVLVALIASPLLWLHYLLLLYVPIALYRPRLSLLWFLPLLLWVTPEAHSQGVTWRIAVALAVVAAVVVQTVGVGFSRGAARRLAAT
ncbi:MAG: alpha,2-mannosyltransferase [Gaiellaceae bacterium]|nr:alpha,2-mannosyltransferase [Gaiellaceae bacterium]